MSGTMKTILGMMTAAVLAMGGTQATATSLTAGPGVGIGTGASGGVSGGGSGAVGMTRRVCVPKGPNNTLCFYLSPPTPRHVLSQCCYVKVERRKMRVFGRLRTVYVDKGRTCVSTGSAGRCLSAARR